MIKFSHLEAIELRLARAKARLSEASAREHAFCWHEVRMIEKERENEIAFLRSRGVEIPADMTDDELLKELGL